MTLMNRFPVVALAVVACVGCIEPVNPCDPEADPELQGEGTVLSGVVRDVDGAPLASVPVALTGRAETALSAEDGTFTFSNLPPAPFYEVNALPAPPLVGGRTRTAALTCQGRVDDVVVHVVVPPASPDVEVVRASGDRRLLVAFGGVLPVEPADTDDVYAGGGDGSDQSYRPPEEVMTDCNGSVSSSDVSFRVQVRSPFSPWQDAVVTPFPWSASPPANEPGTAEDERIAVDALGAESLYMLRTDDWCGAALCTQFSYLDDELAAPAARCAEVVGTVAEDAGRVDPLEPFASYHVRVLAERSTPVALRDAQGLPARVEAGAAAQTGQISLVPGSVLPVANGDGSERDDRSDDVLALVPVAGGRFTVVTAEEVVVVGDGGDTMGEDVRQSFSGAQNASASDTAASDAATSTMFAAGASDVRPLGVLTSGKWVRVLRKMDGAPSIEKLYIGADAADALDGPSDPELANNDLAPQLMFDPEAPELGAVRDFDYLRRTPGSLAAEGVTPEDAYVVVHERALLLVEHTRREGPLALEYFTLPATQPEGRVSTSWADSDTGAKDAALGGACQQLVDKDGDDLIDADVLDWGDAETLTDAVGASRRASVCFDVETALGEPVSLTDVEILDEPGPAPDPDRAFALFADAANDRVLVARAAALRCAGCGADPPSLARALRSQAVRVGREPRGMTRSARLDACTAGVPAARTQVVLVANRQGGDVSVLAVNDADAVEEVAIVPVPTNVVGFLDDADGPTCADPFAWALGEDGRVFPIDMRGTPSIPVCGAGLCEVSTRGRGVTGAVARAPAGAMKDRARALVGGPGLLGELGFFKPQALRGAAFLEPIETGALPPEEGQR